MTRGRRLTLHMRLEPWPAGKPILARERVLRIGQLCTGVLLLQRQQQFFCLFLEVIEVRACRQIARHDYSSGPVSAYGQESRCSRIEKNAQVGSSLSADWMQPALHLRS